MYEFFYKLSVLADTAAQETTTKPQNFQTLLIMFATIGVAFYLIILRPQNKERREKEQQMAALSKGDYVVTIGGIHGKITRVGKSNKTVEIEVAKNTRILINQPAVASVIKQSKGKSPEMTADEEME